MERSRWCGTFCVSKIVENMVEGGATNFSNFIIRPSGGGKRVSRQHRAVPHPVTLVSYFFNRSHRNNDFSFSGRIEIQAKIFRLLLHFWPERRGQIFSGGSRSKSRNSGRIFPTIFQLSASKKCRNFFCTKCTLTFDLKGQRWCDEDE